MAALQQPLPEKVSMTDSHLEDLETDARTIQQTVDPKEQAYLRRAVSADICFLQQEMC
jgi:hypothetical protein